MPDTLPERLTQRVSDWRDAGYPTPYAAVAEILTHQRTGDGTDGAPRGYRYLRPPQVAAIETYLYLRLQVDTPKVPDLYRTAFGGGSAEMLAALGLPEELYEQPLALADTIGMSEADLASSILAKVESDPEHAKAHSLDALRETLSLDYPSYILALAMGAGKTTLVAAIIALEFALGLEHPDGPFLRNALVFAPGKTIFNALREISQVPYGRILPKRHADAFLTNVRMCFTRDGEQDLPVVAGSPWNLIVTNTEKIRLQAKPRRRRNATQLELQLEKAKAKVVANLRLQKLASLPRLGIFSDEAHHTYGQALDKELKRVRQTVDYLARETDVAVVVNTTGTPYYKRQLLRDVVYWYGLSQGIEDDILKDVSGSIQSYELDDAREEDLLRQIVRDFVGEYGDVRLPDGAPARAAVYFPKIKDLQRARPVIEAELSALGLGTGVVLEAHNKATEAELRAFDELGQSPESPVRFVLLVNKGTEGWNCPSLFATALVRKLSSSNNFVLQAATRCLRQVVGNTRKARIYLTHENRAILERQLEENYGETLSSLDRTQAKSETRQAVVRRTDLPPLVVRLPVRRVVPDVDAEPAPIALERPTVAREEGEVVYYTTGETGRLIPQRTGTFGGDTTVSVYGAASRLASLFRLPTLDLLGHLRPLYPDGQVPVAHLAALETQLEGRARTYTVKEEVIEQALALLRLDGFDRERVGGETAYVTTIRYRPDREHLFLALADAPNAALATSLSFHYDPYGFDSRPEKDFLVRLLDGLDVDQEEVQDVLFTGGLTDRRKTDVFVEYEGEDGRWHDYYPDFVVRLCDGRVLIVEVKSEAERGDVTNGEDGLKAAKMRELERLNPERVRYEMLFTASDSVLDSDLAAVKSYIDCPTSAPRPEGAAVLSADPA